MIYTTYKNGDDWGMVYDCFTHINDYQVVINLDILINPLTITISRVFHNGYVDNSQ